MYRLWYFKNFISVQSHSPVRLSASPCGSTPGFLVHHRGLLNLMPIELVMISSCAVPCFSCLQSFPTSGLFQWVSSLHQMAKVMEIQFQLNSSNEYSGLISFGSVASPCKPRDSQESSPTPQFKSFSSLALSFLYGPTLLSIHDFWKKKMYFWLDGPLLAK